MQDKKANKEQALMSRSSLRLFSKNNCGAIPKGVTTNADKLKMWLEIKDNPNPIFEEWTDEHEQKYEEPKSKEFNIKDAHFGRAHN